MRVTERFGGRSAFLVGSGRTGLNLQLEEMARLRPGRVEVAVAGYTCYSVAAAIVRAGLRVRPLVAAQAMGAEVGGRAVGSFGDM